VTWGRYGDEYTEHPAWESVSYEARWLMFCMTQECCKHLLRDGRLGMSRVLRCSDVPREDVPARLAELEAVGRVCVLVAEDVVVVVDAERHVLPETVELRMERDRIRKRHQRGKHDQCDPATCELARSAGQSQGLSTGLSSGMSGRDGTGRSLEQTPLVKEQSGVAPFLREARDRAVRNGTAPNPVVSR
jgi:hypothetical protein